MLPECGGRKGLRLMFMSKKQTEVLESLVSKGAAWSDLLLGCLILEMVGKTILRGIRQEAGYREFPKSLSVITLEGDNRISKHFSLSRRFPKD